MFRTLYIISLLIVTYPVSADINGRIVRVLDGDKGGECSFFAAPG